MRLGLFGGKDRDAAREEAARQNAALAEIKRLTLKWLRVYEADPETAVTVNEIACLDPACPGNETIVLIMEPGRKTRAVKIAKPAQEIGEAELRQNLFPMV